MAKKFLSAIQLLTVGADPVTASAGDLYFNNSSNLVKYFDGTSWVAVPKNFSNLGDVEFTTLQNNNTISYNSVTGKWENASPPSGLIETGPSYPISGAENGELFYNTSENRLAIFYDEVWRELAYYPETIDADGGNSRTEVFGLILDGGNSFTTTFVNIYDCGNASGYPDEYFIDGGNSSTTVFVEVYSGGSSDTSVFSPTVDGGNSL